MFESERQKLVD